MSNAAIRCCSVSKRFGDVTAVSEVTLAAPKGGILALLGPSGCGKTTLLRLIAGFEAPDMGWIEIGGRPVVGNGLFVPPEKRKVGIVFQDYALFPHLDVAHNVAYGLPAGNGRQSRVKGILSTVGLASLASRMPHELSGGQQQRVALARALAPAPEVVLLDEPFSNLDASLRARVRAEMREILREAGATAIFVTHDQEEALSMADSVGVMLEGRIAQVAEPEQLYRHPATREVATFVGDAEFLPAAIANGVVSCELGTWPSDSRLEGKVDMMLRPEGVDLVLDPASPLEVAGREYFGHSQIVRVCLPSGRAIRAKLGPDVRLAPGDHVRIMVRHEEIAVFRPIDALERRFLHRR